MTTRRADTYYVMTEFGAVNLKGLSSPERADRATSPRRSQTTTPSLRRAMIELKPKPQTGRSIVATFGAERVRNEVILAGPHPAHCALRRVRVEKACRLLRDCWLHGPDGRSDAIDRGARGHRGRGLCRARRRPRHLDSPASPPDAARAFAPRLLAANHVLPGMSRPPRQAARHSADQNDYLCDKRQRC